MRERLHRFEVAHHLFDKRRLLPARLRLLFEKGIGVRRDVFGDKQGQGSDDDHDQRDLPAHRKHESQRPRDREHPRKELREAHQKPVGKLFGVRDDAAHRVPVRVGIDIGQGEAGDLPEGVLPDGAHHFIGDAVVADAHQPLRHRRHRDGDADEDENSAEPREIDVAGADDAVHRVPHEHGHVQRESDGHRRQQQGEDEGQGVSLHIAEHPLHRPLGQALARFLFRDLSLFHDAASSPSSLYCES